MTATTTSLLVPANLVHTLTVSLPPVKTHLSLCGKHEATCGTIVDAVTEYAVVPITQENAAWSTISLHEILDPKRQSPYLSCHDRMQIAVSISSSVLQLHGSPWLLNTLSSRDIHFFVSRDGGEDVAILRSDYPVIIRRPAAAVAATSADAGVAGVAGVALKRNPTLLSLAYLLLELTLGDARFEPPHALQGTTEAVAVGDTSAVSDYLAAQRALERAAFPSENYRSAVSRCLQGGLHRPGPGFDSEDFCQDVYSGVVALLERDLENA